MYPPVPPSTLGARTTHTYDVLGAETSRVVPSGATTRFTYDAAHRLGERVQPEGTVVYGYTVSGQRQFVQDARGVTSYGYDAESRLTQETMPTGHGLSYTWDEEGRLTQLQGTVGGTSFTETYGYDAESRLTHVTTGGQTYGMTYDATNQLETVTYPGGVVTTYGYDGLDRLNSITVRGPAPLTPTLLALTYTRTLGGHIVSITEGTGETRAYTYDAAERLLSEVVTSGGLPVSAETFVYDAAGNRTSRTHEVTGAQTQTQVSTYDARDRLSTVGGLQSTWDDDGRLLSRPGTPSYTLSWDSQDRLTRITYADGTALRNVYDADGTRVATEQLSATGTVLSRTDYLVSTMRGLTHVV